MVANSREQMLRDWQQSRDRKLSVAMDGDMEVDAADKENAPENRTPRKNFRDSTASSDAKRKPAAAKGKDALDDEPRRERCVKSRLPESNRLGAAARGVVYGDNRCDGRDGTYVVWQCVWVIHRGPRCTAAPRRHLSADRWAGSKWSSRRSAQR